ncbi:protein kinase subdomain-containing protein [Penicillium sp. IBT 18751x]|nr:protein kinase subdomain-containing protein [Penicillium sp. IBT 18751x]
MMQQEATIHGGEPNPLDTTGLCLLSLDGGGVRGLSSLYILKSIIDRLNHARQQTQLPPVKPCEVFDLIGGTSTGGLIAIMLGRLEMDVDQCIDAYSDLTAAVFGKKLHSIPINFKGDITARFDSATLESAIQKVIEDNGFSKQDLFNDGTGFKDGTTHGCKTFVCTADRHTKEIIHLRSYSLSHEPDIRTTIYQAALATSAATTFFEPVIIGDRSFADGGLGANNPVDEVEGEATNIWCPETGDLKPQVKCFISIGTGNPGKKPFEDNALKFLGQTVVQIATETENTERRFIARWAKHFDDKRYFRFNVEHGLQEIGLEEYRKKGAMKAATEGYLTHITQKFRTRLRYLSPLLYIHAARYLELIVKWFFLYLVHCFDVPFDLTAVPVTENFLGRQGELEQLWQSLQPTKSDLRKVAIIHGLGGMGKTQLAIRFARIHKNDFTAIFWLSGKDRATLMQSLSSILPRLPGQSQTTDTINNEEIEQRSRTVLQWLASEGNSRWLIIFDNIDQYSPVNSAIGRPYNIKEFFPGADHGSILITSRNQRSAELGISFPIHRLHPKDAIQLLLQISRLSAENIEKELKSDPDTIALTNRLGGLPLAIIIAGAFMRETGTNITEYLQYYQESWSDLQLQSNPGHEYQHGNMIQTWLISYREIQKRDENAARLLLLLAHFDNRDIWYELVREGSHSPDAPLWLKGTTLNGLAFKVGVRVLIEFSLLEIKHREGSYSMHPVVQDWCLYIAGADSNVNLLQLKELALISVGFTVPRKTDRHSLELQQRLIPHANYVCRGDWSNDSSVWGVFHGLGNLYLGQGKLKEAEDLYQRALTGYKKDFGPDHTMTLGIVNNLSLLYSNQGKLQEAEEMYQRALTGYKETLGPDHIATLNIVGNLGLLYSNQGKLQEAEEMYQRALTGCKETLGPDHTATLNIVGNLGLLYSDQGKLEEAEEMYRRALRGYEEALGPDHMSTLVIVNNLGNLYSDQGKLEETEEMYRRALRGYEKALGPDDTVTLATVNNLGLLYSTQGMLGKAEDMYLRALAGYKKALVPDYTSTLTTVHNLGNLYSKQGKLKEAEEIYQRALVGFEKALVPDHTSILDEVKNLGSIYTDQGKFKEAEAGES